MVSNEDSEIRELSQSGIQFISTYVGSIPIKASLRDMRSTDLRLRVVKQAILAVSLAAGIADENAKTGDDDTVALLLVGDSPPTVKNVQVALNVSSKAISMSHADAAQPHKNGGLVARHKLQYISFAGAGDPPLHDLMGYIAKVKEDRRCHVLRMHDVRVSRVMICVNKAMELNAAKLTADSSKMERIDPTPSERTTIPPETSSDKSISREAFETLTNQSWYHGLLTREDAERMLVYVGDFLVRQSSRIPGQVILSGRDGARVQHVLLMDEQAGEIRTRDQQIKTVVDLVNHHYVHKVPMFSDDCTIELVRPIPRREVRSVESR